MFKLEDLKTDIQGHTEDVKQKTKRLLDACSEWEFANNLTNDVCSTARRSAYAAYRRWLLVQPVLQVWMALDARTMATAYAQAQFEGMYEEFVAHIEAKKKMEVSNTVLMRLGILPYPHS